MPVFVQASVESIFTSSFLQKFCSVGKGFYNAVGKLTLIWCNLLIFNNNTVVLQVSRYILWISQHFAFFWWIFRKNSQNDFSPLGIVKKSNFSPKPASFLRNWATFLQSPDPIKRAALVVLYRRVSRMFLCQNLVLANPRKGSWVQGVNHSSFSEGVRAHPRSRRSRRRIGHSSRSPA